jgi:hypothetical protein
MWRKFNCKIKYTLVGKGCSKKRMFYCNDKNKFLTNSKECWLRTGVYYIL